tara:strand:+ start:1490 stop:2347 length:858 start_codon:yes stop_codon:yes gene_type:complete
MAYKIKNKKTIIEQENSTGWLTNVLSYFNKMTEEQKKALQSTITLCNNCKSDIQNKKNNTQSCVACKDFNASMKNTKINESKKVKMTESQFNSVIKKLSNEQQTNKITKGDLLMENKKCYRKNLNADASLRGWKRCGCSRGGGCKAEGPDWGPGMVVSGGEGCGGKCNDKLKHSKEASKHILKLKESDLINIIKRTLNESQLITEEKCNVRCKYSHDVCPDGDSGGAKSWNAHGSVGMYGSANCSEFGYSACATHCGTPGMVTPDGNGNPKPNKPLPNALKRRRR